MAPLCYDRRLCRRNAAVCVASRPAACRAQAAMAQISSRLRDSRPLRLTPRHGSECLPGPAHPASELGLTRAQTEFEPRRLTALWPSRHFGHHSTLTKAPQPCLTGQAASHQHAVCQDASWSGQSHCSHATLKSISPLLDLTRFFGTGQIHQPTTCWAATPEPPPWRRLRRQWHPAASAVCGHSFCLTASDRGMPCGA